jgi:hypothetical protein
MKSKELPTSLIGQADEVRKIAQGILAKMSAVPFFASLPDM